jgi:hypothetical protein
MVIRRSGRSSLGCLFTLLVIAAVAYFGVNVGEAYMRFYQFQDAMRQEVRFASQNSDAVILRHLSAEADSLGLPEAAADVTIRRDGRRIEMGSEYYMHVELPLTVREVHFAPHAEGTF